MAVEKKEPITLLTLKEAAEVLRVSTKTVRDMIHKGMPARKVGRAWRISVASLNQWFDTGVENGAGNDAEAKEPAGAGR